MELFGFQIARKEKTESQKSFVVPESDEGAIDTYSGSGAGYYGTYYNLDTPAKSEAELIKRYRDISAMADVDMAIEDIVNEAIANLDQDPPLSLDLRNIKVSNNIKKEIEQEFNTIIDIMDFNKKAHDIFRRWYIDGRLYYHKVIDTEKPRDGLVDIRYIDPRKIKKVRDIKRKKDPRTGVEFITEVNEYYVFSDQGLTQSKNVMTPPASALRVSKDSVAYVSSGLMDPDTNMVLSYLHKVVKPANQLRMMENALVIYRLARAPERRVFYIDVGNLPKQKAEQYVKDIMARYRNKVVYDADTGEIRDDKKFMSMLEDFWLPRREGGKGTEITTLPGGENLGQIADIEYFQKKLYQALNVPISRLEQSGGLNFGRAAEISRDELKFVKFCDKLTNKFSTLFDDLLKTQLLLKNIITEQDWDKLIRPFIRYVFTKDAFYAETKKHEIIKSRVELLDMVAVHQGTFFSKKYIQKEILMLTDEQIAEIEKENEAEPAPIPVDELPPSGPPAPAPKKPTPKKK